MQKINMKILPVALLAALTLISSQSKAFECNKPSTKTEKFICKEESLARLNKNFNLVLSKTIEGLSIGDKEELNKKINILLIARDLCMKPNQKFSDSKNSVKNFLSDSSKTYKLQDENFINGCIATWYNSVSDALSNQKNSNLFKIPLLDEYLNEYNKLQEKPYIFKINEVDQDMLKFCQEDHKDDPNFDCNDMKNQFSEELTYTLFFLINKTNFSKMTKESYSYHAGAAHSNGWGSSKFITQEGETEKINKSAYSCSIPLKNPVILNGDIYLPEQISFTKFFKNLLGEFSESQCYACSGSYHADCLMRLKKIEENDAYIIFNGKDFIENQFSESDKTSSLDYRKCALEIIIKNQSDINEIKKLVNSENVQPIIIKESSSQAILSEIKKDCKKYEKIQRKITQN